MQLFPLRLGDQQDLLAFEVLRLVLRDQQEAEADELTADYERATRSTNRIAERSSFRISRFQGYYIGSVQRYHLWISEAIRSIEPLILEAQEDSISSSFLGLVQELQSVQGQ